MIPARPTNSPQKETAEKKSREMGKHIAMHLLYYSANPRICELVRQKLERGGKRPQPQLSPYTISLDFPACCSGDVFPSTSRRLRRSHTWKTFCENASHWLMEDPAEKSYDNFMGLPRIEIAYRYILPYIVDRDLGVAWLEEDKWQESSRTWQGARQRE